MQGTMVNNSGVIKNIKVGFSWTTLFFGLFVPLFRGDWKWFLIILIADVLTMGIANIIFCFIYNKIYINELLEKGFMAEDERTRRELVRRGFIKDAWQSN